MIRVVPALVIFLAAGAEANEGALREDRALEEFVDSMVSEHMERYHLPGVTVAVVEGGEVRLAKGYGFADLDHRTPVSADETLFSLASVTKVLTAATVMKVVESGRLRMDEDVNRYLTGFQIPGAPITTAHLLTHTAGFDEPYTGVFAPEDAPIPPLLTYLAAEIPARTERPGELISYSNYGISLAGGLVEETTGVPFARFVEEEVFRPLGMNHSFLRDPSPNPLAVGYTFRDGSYHDAGVKYLRQILIPAAGLHSTGADMARFVLGLLQEQQGFLKESTLREMHRRRFLFHPRIGGVAFGLREHLENGIRVLMQDGDWEGFSSRLALLPERGVGFFVVYNTSSIGARASMMSSFLDRYYPEPPPVRPADRLETSQPLERFEGTYLWQRFPERSALSLLKMFARIRVERTKNGELRVSSSGRLPNFIRFPDFRFSPGGPLLFERLDGEGRLAFRESEREDAPYLLLDVPAIESTGSMLFQRVPWYGVPRLQIGFAGAILLVVLSGLYWPLVHAYRFARGFAIEAPTHDRRAHLLGTVVALLAASFFIALVPALHTIETFGSHLFLRATLSIPLLIAVLVPGLCWFAFSTWRRGLWSLPSRLHYSLFTAATIALLAQLYYWNLVGFHN